ncbi:MAG: hypothetical protein ACRDD7_18045 [Peptostreptococcaceae bacterium]
MRKKLISIVQKCATCNFLINEIIKNSDLTYKPNFIHIKNENLMNIKILCYLYESLYKDVLIPEDVNSMDLNKNLDGNIRILFKLFFEIISDLKSIKYKLKNPYCNQFLNKLIYSYFSFTSCISCVLPQEKLENNKVIKFNFSKIRNYNNLSVDDLREICIDSINFYFDYLIKPENIEDEYCEIFFQNDPNHKFHQYFFHCSDRSFKIRISVKDSSVFYIYQIIDDSIEISPSMTKEDAKIYSDSYLRSKLNEDFDDLIFDKDYLNIYSYMNIPECYKFKYNFKDSIGKINLNKGIYITIDARFMYTQELYLF